MNLEHQEKLEAWLVEEVDALIAQGGIQVEFAELVIGKLTETHSQEMGEAEFLRGSLKRVLESAEPEKLREIAAAARKCQLHDFAYGLEYLADLREPGRRWNPSTIKSPRNRLSAQWLARRFGRSRL
ncbi:MAG: hypothetical protein WB586_26300 [Chthoniobacterales bacterium]